MTTSRREFLQESVALTALAALGRHAIWGSASLETGDRVLVVVQLTGGNDGLNTVVPFEDDRYYRARPRLRVAKGAVVKLDKLHGLHPAMESLRAPWDRGELAIVNSVGYPAPDRSHFRSMDIWHTARTDVNVEQVGWLGRASDSLGIHRGTAPALHVGSTEQPLSLVARGLVNPSLVDLESVRFRSPVDARTHRDALRTLYTSQHDGLAGWIAGEADAAFAFASRVEAVLTNDKPAVPYPSSALARKLRCVEQLLRAGSAFRAVQVEIDGFDTHASQGDVHPALLGELAESLTAFQSNLRAHKLDNRVVVLVFSEFGRRVRENASGGTDHGAAAPMFLMGTAVKGGIHGDPPDLEHLDDGDVAMGIDFRRVYAAVLEKWLSVDSRTVLGEAFEPLPVL